MEEFFQQITSLSITNPIFIVIMISFLAIVISAPTEKMFSESTSDQTLSHNQKKRGRPSMTALLQIPYMFKQFKSIFTNLREKFLSNYLAAFYIVGYRQEWGKYRMWDSGDLDLRKPTGIRDCKHRRRSRREAAYMHDHRNCQQVTINVSGMKFMTQQRTLDQFPNSILGDKRLREPFYDPATSEYFFDRNRLCFEAILYYYQTGGVLKKPAGVPADLFTDELKFFQLAEAVKKFDRKEVAEVLPKNFLCKKIWLLFEYPFSSLPANIVAIISIMVIAVSTFLFCVETMNAFAEDGGNVLFKRGSDDTDDEVYDLHDPFFFTETVCICWFVFEYIIRLISCPKIHKFLSDFLNMVDLIAIFPYFLSLAIYASNRYDVSTVSTNSSTTTIILRVIRLVRVFRIFKLSRHSKGLKVLGRTLRASVRELGLLIFFLVIGVIFFSSAMYFAEDSVPQSRFTSIPEGFWWAIATMTTVGFGDLVPTGVYGKIVGASCTIAGVLTIALPVPVIVSNFNYFYHQDMAPPTSIQAEEYVHVENCPNRSWRYIHKHPQPLAGHNVVRNRYYKTSSDSDSEFEKLKYENRQRR